MKFPRALAYIVVAAVVVCLAWFFLLKKDYRVGEAGMISSYQSLIASGTLKSDWKELNCSVELNESLAQDLHIARDWSGTFCAEELRGRMYDKFKQPFSCNAGDAARIDGAVRQNGNCTFPVGSPLGGDVNDYHAFVLVCVADLTNWTYVGGGACPSQYPQSVIYAVVDSKGNVFY